MADRPAIRVLIVDDNELWCLFLSAMVADDPKMVVVGEAIDGAECVQLAQQLQPDLILLDIGLPSLDGIEAARQIASVSPQSKIIFVTQEPDDEVRQAALRSGAHGFVLKSDVISDLRPAIDAALTGDRFSPESPSLPQN